MAWISLSVFGVIGSFGQKRAYKTPAKFVFECAVLLVLSTNIMYNSSLVHGHCLHRLRRENCAKLQPSH